MSKGRTVVKTVTPLVIIALAIFATIALVKSKTDPVRTERPDQGILVEVMNAELSTRTIDVSAKGEVTAARTLVLQPRVPGEVVWVSKKLVSGGLIDKGEPLIKIDRADYMLALQQRKISVAQAEAQVRLEEGQQDVARKEWELFSKDMESQSDPSLALRGPQKLIAEANLDAAKSQLKRAKLDLERTTIRSPLNAYVRTESVEVGQLVNSASPMATLVGTDEFWVQLSVPVDRLGLVDIPGVNANNGAQVKVIQDVGGSVIRRDGEVRGLLGDLDPVGRMGRVMVSVNDPLNLKKPPSERGLPMLIGAYVNVAVAAGGSTEVVALPRRVVRNGDEVYLYSNHKLTISQIEIVWRGDDEVLVRGGVKPGDQIVTSKIGAPIEGMKLRLNSAASEDAQ